jgi:ribosomal protein L19
MRTLDAIEKDWHRKKAVKFDVGDSVDVHVRIIEGDRERIQIFAGVVIAKRHEGSPRRSPCAAWCRAKASSASSRSTPRASSRSS